MSSPTKVLPAGQVAFPAQTLALPIRPAQVSAMTIRGREGLGFSVCLKVDSLAYYTLGRISTISVARFLARSKPSSVTRACSS